MKCSCGGLMRQHIIALNDVWWICIICGRQKPADKVPVSIRREVEQEGTALVIKQVAVKQAQPVSTKKITLRNNTAKSSRPTSNRDEASKIMIKKSGRI